MLKYIKEMKGVIATETRKEYIKKLLFLNLSLLLFALVYSFAFHFLANDGEVSLCLFKDTLHIYCPGCGGSRALIALLRFDFKESFILFPPLLIGALIVLELDVRFTLCAIKSSEKYVARYTYRRFYILVAALILNFALKNILLVFFRIDLIGDFL